MLVNLYEVITIDDDFDEIDYEESLKNYISSGYIDNIDIYRELKKETANNPDVIVEIGYKLYYLWDLIISIPDSKSGAPLVKMFVTEVC